MSNGINLRELERRAFLSYHGDGILDVMIGFGLIIAALWIYAEMPWLVGSWVPVMTPIYLQAKKNITVPRLGHVEFSGQRKGKTKKTLSALVVFNLILFAGGFGAWMAMDIGGKPQWLIELLENYMILTGVLGLVASWIVAFISDLRRFYIYGLMNLAVFTISGFFRLHIALGMVLLGIIVVLYGLILLLDFRRKYPIIEYE
jgi:hypothetical protein